MSPRVPLSRAVLGHAQQGRAVRGGQAESFKGGRRPARLLPNNEAILLLPAAAAPRRFASRSRNFAAVTGNPAATFTIPRTIDHSALNTAPRIVECCQSRRSPKLEAEAARCAYRRTTTRTSLQFIGKRGRRGLRKKKRVKRETFCNRTTAGDRTETRRAVSERQPPDRVGTPAVLALRGSASFHVSQRDAFRTRLTKPAHTEHARPALRGRLDGHAAASPWLHATNRAARHE
ncbi:hypothetical protein MTO96_022301 [Rhipicephalus appendiculatus]